MTGHVRNMMHPDYWVEIPEGEVQLGLTEEQREMILRLFFDKAGYQQRPVYERAIIDAWLVKLRQGEHVGYEESKPLGISIVPTFFDVPARKVWIKRFYMSRFQLINTQYDLLTKRTPVELVPGVWEVPETWTSKRREKIANRCVAQVQSEEIVKICTRYGFRFPTADEWEKAARGTAGRLYPWGNDWDESRGFFYYAQEHDKHCADGKAPVEAFPDGISPYGVWNMAGGLPELVTVPRANYIQRQAVLRGQHIYIDIKGTHPRESSQDRAWIDHIVARTGYGDWVTFRPVLDELPKYNMVEPIQADNIFSRLFRRISR